MRNNTTITRFIVLHHLSTLFLFIHVTYNFRGGESVGCRKDCIWLGINGVWDITCGTGDGGLVGVRFCKLFCNALDLSRIR